jgi:hypothetical protein
MRSKIKEITAFETADFRVFTSYAAAKAHIDRINAKKTELKMLAAMQKEDKVELKKLWRDCDQKKRSKLQSLVSRRAALIDSMSYMSRHFNGKNKADNLATSDQAKVGN